MTELNRTSINCKWSQLNKNIGNKLTQQQNVNNQSNVVVIKTAVKHLVQLHLSISVIRATASFDAVGMMEARAVAVNCGNLKFMLAASLWPSGHSLESGVPSTEQILNISSISELPGNSGLKQPLLLETSLLREQI